MKKFIGYEKGVDLGGWLSQCCHTEEHYSSFIRKEDIQKISSWGLDHVRLPIDYELIEKENGEPRESGYKHIDDAIEWCSAEGLNIVLDLHKTAGFSFDKGEGESGFFDSEPLQQRFCRLWENMAKRYGNIGKNLSFELLNEVTDREYIGTWNAVLYKCIEGIRAIAPDVTIIEGSYWNNSPDALPDLDKPFDENVVLSFHCYDPMEFTHQGAPWVEDRDLPVGTAFDSEKITADYFAERFAPALRTAEKYNAALYCGEYGVIDRADPAGTLEWFRTINAAFRKFGISHAAWNYKNKDFGLSDEHLASVIDELVKYL